MRNGQGPANAQLSACASKTRITPIWQTATEKVALEDATQGFQPRPDLHRRLAARWLIIPPPAFNRKIARSGVLRQVAAALAFPLPPVHFDQRVGEDRSAPRNQRGSLARALERAGIEINVGPFGWQAESGKLCHRWGVEWHIGSALNATGAVPVRVSMSQYSKPRHALVPSRAEKYVR